MAHSDDKDKSSKRGWLGKRQIAAVPTVLGSLYEQIAPSFKRSVDDLERNDQPLGENDVVHQVADTLSTLQGAGRVVIQRAQSGGGPSQAEVEQAVQNALLRLGILSRDRVEKISHELDELNDLLDQQLAERRAAKAEQIEE